MAQVENLYRFPVKGMFGVSCATLNIDANVGVEGDRNTAFAKDTNLLDGWARKAGFYNAAQNPQMASLREYSSQEIVKALDLKTIPRLVNTGGHFNMTDTAGPTVTLLNLASLRELEKAVGQNLDFRRFRMNVMVDGLEPFEELTWVPEYPGKRVITLGGHKFEVFDACERCMAINADPRTGERNLPVLEKLRELMESRGYKSPQRKVPAVMGLVLRPLEDGILTLGSELMPPLAA